MFVTVTNTLEFYLHLPVGIPYRQAMSDLLSPTCGSCLRFLRNHKEPNGLFTGRCQIRPELNLITETLTTCSKFHLKPNLAGKVKVPKRTRAVKPRTRSQEHQESVRPKRATLSNPVTGDTSGEIDMDRNGLKQILRELLEEESMYGYVDMGRKWDGGTLILNPADDGLQAKEIPIETFFHKIIMVRDRLRVLEAKLDAHNDLSKTDKVELQQYISKAYGSLTTFNVLFQNKEDQFSSK